MATDRVAYRSKRPKQAKRTWRDYSDAQWHGYSGLPSAASLHPDTAMIQAYAAGDSNAQAIIAAWNPAFSLASLIRVEALP
jgi:hypothetical protein